MFIAVKRKDLILYGGVILFFLCALACIACPPELPVFSPLKASPAVFVIDAGHGGEDGGALSADGVKESGINLAVAQKTALLLQFIGAETKMTRTEDVSIHSADAETLRQKKASDLKNRVALVNETPNAILVSIHQNSLPSVPSVHGAQVFYGAAERSGALASSVQSALNQCVNTGNEKHEKKIDSSIYLMKNVTCPAILIECGFLSNAAEAQRLQEPAYQTKLAVAIVSGLLGADERAAEREAP